MNARRVLMIASAVLLVVAAPFALAAQRAFRLQPFSSLELDVPARYVISAGNAGSARVRGDSEVIDRIVFEQHDDLVRVYVPGSITIQGQLVIEIDAVGLKELTVNGAGEVHGHGFIGSEFSLHSTGAAAVKLTGLDVDELRVDMQGSGSVELSGRATDERARMAGSGQYRAAGLGADKVDARLEGSGSAEVLAREKLSVRISGSGSVRYRGDPKLSTSIDGSGTVERM
jgi:Putative auto-transporter adhesin, head GIN domain